MIGDIEMRKGFTLIELLAVIVILAVIALIATPLVMHVIDDSKKAALKDSAYGVLEAASLYYVRNSEDISVKEFTLEDGKFVSDEETLAVKGKLSGTGNLIITKNGELTLCLNSDNNYAYKNYDTSVVTTGSGDVCKIENNFLINKYVSYLASNGSSIDGYYTKEQINELLDNYVSKDSIDGHYTKEQINELLENYISKDNVDEYIGNNSNVGQIYTHSNVINIAPRGTWVSVPTATWTIPAGTWVIDFEFGDYNTGTGIWAFNFGNLGISDTIWKSSADYSIAHFSWVKTYDEETTGHFNYYQQLSATARNITFKMTAVRIK